MADNFDPADLLPASADKIAETLSYALRFDDRVKSRRVDGELMANITADWLVRHLLRSNYVVMRKKPERPHSTS